MRVSQQLDRIFKILVNKEPQYQATWASDASIKLKIPLSTVEEISDLNRELKTNCGLKKILVSALSLLILVL